MSASSFTFGFIDDGPDVLGGNAILGGKFSLKNATGGITAANFFYLGIRQSDGRMSFAVRVATLLLHVIMVVFWSAKKQMSRINTLGIVATVADKQVVRNGAVGKFIGDTMRLTALVATQFDLAVAFAIKRTLPIPTIVRAALVNLFPKAFSQWAIGGGLVTANVLTLPTWVLGLGNFLTATTFAEDRARGMILHSIVSLLDLLTPPNDSTRCGGNYLSASIMPQEAHYV